MSDTTETTREPVASGRTVFGTPGPCRLSSMGEEQRSEVPGQASDAHTGNPAVSTSPRGAGALSLFASSSW